ncbi:MAG: hypothetical protein ABR961_12745 [Thermoanaerobaculaceae bacterium]|jgi:hypothetical protein
MRGNMSLTLVLAGVAAAASGQVLVTPGPRTMEIMPSIRVTEPDGREASVHFVGGLLNVAWQNTGRVPARVNITLHPPGCTGIGTLLVGGIPNNGLEHLYLPATLTDGYYSIRVGEFGSLVTFGCSPRFHIRFEYGVTDPRMGTIWHPGGSATVRWRSASPGGRAVDLVLMGEHSIWGPCLARGTANDGEQAVTIPADAAPGYYRVMLYPGACSSPEFGFASYSESFQVTAR